MERTGFTSLQITKDTTIRLEQITSLTISNYGNAALSVVVNDVPTPVPAFNASIGIPVGSFNIPGDGTACDVAITFIFTGGTGNATLYYRKLKC